MLWAGSTPLACMKSCLLGCAVPWVIEVVVDISDPVLALLGVDNHLVIDPLCLFVIFAVNFFTPGLILDLPPPHPWPLLGAWSTDGWLAWFVSVSGLGFGSCVSSGWVGVSVSSLYFNLMSLLPNLWTVAVCLGLFLSHDVL